MALVTPVRSRAHAPTLAAQPRPSVSVVIPTLNEAENIGWVLERIPTWVGEVILVDGRSTDDTVAVAQSMRDDLVVVLERRPGKGIALRAGFAAARGEVVVMIDADGSMDPREIPAAVDLLMEGNDVVKGSRFLDGGGSTDLSPLRRAGNLGLNGLVNVLYRERFTDLCYGFCAFRREALERLPLAGDGFEIETEIVVKACKEGLRIAEMPSFEAERLSGESNLRTFRDGARALRTLVTERLPARHVPAEAPAAAGGLAVAATTDATGRPLPDIRRRERRHGDRRQATLHSAYDGPERRRGDRRRRDRRRTERAAQASDLRPAIAA